MPIFGGDGGVHRAIKQPYAGAGGAWRNCKAVFAGAGGVWRQIWNSAINGFIIYNITNGKVECYDDNLSLKWSHQATTAGKDGTVFINPVNDNVYFVGGAPQVFISYTSSGSVVRNYAFPGVSGYGHFAFDRDGYLYCFNSYGNNLFKKTDDGTTNTIWKVSMSDWGIAPNGLSYKWFDLEPCKTNNYVVIFVAQGQYRDSSAYNRIVAYNKTTGDVSHNVYSENLNTKETGTSGYALTRGGIDGNDFILHTDNYYSVDRGLVKRNISGQIVWYTASSLYVTQDTQRKDGIIADVDGSLYVQRGSTGTSVTKATSSGSRVWDVAGSVTYVEPIGLALDENFVYGYGIKYNGLSNNTYYVFKFNKAGTEISYKNLGTLYDYFSVTNTRITSHGSMAIMK